jgi:ubiquinone/menaquinone biosynthesis C-methylase UbiE
MTGTLRFDAAASRRTESTYVTEDVVEQRRRILAALDLRPGERVLDVGSGPGFLAIEMAEVVGSTGHVQGVDVSDDMLTMARAREVTPGSAAVEFVGGGAEDLPVADASVDVAVSTQVLEYVADVPKALAEIHRVLRPGGRVLVLDTDWDSIVWHSSDAERMERVLVAWEEHLIDPHLPRTLGPALDAVGFEVATPWVLPLLNAGYRRETYSGGILEIMEAYLAGRDSIPADDVHAWADDLRSLGERYFFSLNRYIFCATKPA